jgi:hypothetical protein
LFFIFHYLDKQDSSNGLARSSSANELALRKKNAEAASNLNNSSNQSTGSKYSK